MEGWNGRFMGTGGGGFSGGSERSLIQPLSRGYAVGATDTGHEGGSGSFALDNNGRFNWMLIRDNAYLGIHEMTVVGKALTEAFYSHAPRYSYFSGCSTGGRQGLMEAQRYPTDYDGIVSGAPAINWTKLHVAPIWGQLLMLEAKHFTPQCKLDAANKAAVTACDNIDSVQDGVLEDPRLCKYNPADLVNKPVSECEPLTEKDTELIQKIWDGPRMQDGSFLWYGSPHGTDHSRLNSTEGEPLFGQPFRITLDWFRYFLTQDPDWDWTTLTHDSFEQFMMQSMEQFSAVLATDNPNLTAFRDHGGKVIIWHGWTDPLIYAQGTIDYYKRVQEVMGGPEKTVEFMRLFMAPGVNHCGGGTGPQPNSVEIAKVIRLWVEHGEAPDSLTAVRRNDEGAVELSRPLCQYPLVARYKGSGNTDDASNFECVSGF